MALTTTKKPANPPAAPPEATAPGTEGQTKKAKRDKVPRVKLDAPEGGFESWPSEFDPKKHKPLRRNEFKDETVWLDRKAEEYERKAKKLRDESEETKRLGPSKERSKAKKLVKVQQELDALKAILQGQGVDVEAALAAAKTKAEGAATKA